MFGVRIVLSLQQSEIDGSIGPQGSLASTQKAVTPRPVYFAVRESKSWETDDTCSASHLPLQKLRVVADGFPVDTECRVAVTLRWPAWINPFLPFGMVHVRSSFIPLPKHASNENLEKAWLL